MNFQNDPNLPDYCPDPSVVIGDSIAALATAVKTRLCANKAYTAEEVARLEAQIAALAGSANLAAQIAELQNLISVLDVDGDGSISELTGIQALAQSALDLATLANTKSDEAKAQALQTAQELATFQSTINGQISTINSQISAVDAKAIAADTKAQSALDAAAVADGKADTNAQGLLALQAQVDAIPDGGVSEEEVNAIKCEIYARTANAWEAAVSAFQTVLAADCVDPNAGGDNGGTGAVL